MQLEIDGALKLYHKGQWTGYAKDEEAVGK